MLEVAEQNGEVLPEGWGSASSSSADPLAWGTPDQEEPLPGAWGAPAGERGDELPVGWAAPPEGSAGGGLR